MKNYEIGSNDAEERMKADDQNLDAFKNVVVKTNHIDPLNGLKLLKKQLLDLSVVVDTMTDNLKREQLDATDEDIV
jgi:hypothetical protein